MIRSTIRIGLATLLLANCVAPSGEDAGASDEPVESAQQAQIVENGINFNGINFNGINFNGINFNGINFNGINFNGSTLTGVKFGSVANQKLTDLTALAANGLPVTGKTTGTASVENGVAERARAMLRYLASCAWDEKATFKYQYTVNGETFTERVDGALGLAPEWLTGPISAANKKKVSACIVSRVNAYGHKVRLSFRGAGLKVTSEELKLYKAKEGAFWGDLFGTSMKAYACNDSAAGTTASVSQRLCATAGLATKACEAVTPVGSCSTACTGQDADGNWINCKGTDNVVVSTPVTTFLDVQIAQAALGDGFTCIRNSVGDVRCSGLNDHGQTGDGTTVNRTAGAVFAQIGGLDTDGRNKVKVREIIAGRRHSCARDVNDRIWCWGGNDQGQCGDKTWTDRPVPVKVLDSAGAHFGNVSELFTGANWTCARRYDGTVWCWGKNDWGQLATGDRVDRNAPVQVVQLGTNAVKMAMGGGHSCVLHKDGKTYCWGRNTYGQLGLGDTTDRLTPTAVSGLGTRGHRLFLSAFSSCAMYRTDQVKCFGEGTRGQLGDNKLSNLEPVVDDDVIGLPATCAHDPRVTGTALAAGCGRCVDKVLESSTYAYCATSSWDAACVSRANAVCGGNFQSGYAELSGGSYGNHYCVLGRDGGLRCWGANENGQLGIGNNSNQNIARPVAMDATLPQVYDGVWSGTTHTCARSAASGQLWCWGDNAHGQLNVGDVADRNKPTLSKFPVN